MSEKRKLSVGTESSHFQCYIYMGSLRGLWSDNEIHKKLAFNWKNTGLLARLTKRLSMNYSLSEEMRVS